MRLDVVADLSDLQCLLSKKLCHCSDVGCLNDNLLLVNVICEQCLLSLVDIEVVAVLVIFTYDGVVIYVLDDVFCDYEPVVCVFNELAVFFELLLSVV